MSEFAFRARPVSKYNCKNALWFLWLAIFSSTSLLPFLFCVTLQLVYSTSVSCSYFFTVCLIVVFPVFPRIFPNISRFCFYLSFYSFLLLLLHLIIPFSRTPFFALSSFFSTFFFYISHLHSFCFSSFISCCAPSYVLPPSVKLSAFLSSPFCFLFCRFAFLHISLRYCLLLHSLSLFLSLCFGVCSFSILCREHSCDANYID